MRLILLICANDCQKTQIICGSLQRLAERSIAKCMRSFARILRLFSIGCLKNGKRLQKSGDETKVWSPWTQTQLEKTTRVGRQQASGGHDNRRARRLLLLRPKNDDGRQAAARAASLDRCAGDERATRVRRARRANGAHRSTRRRGHDQRERERNDANRRPFWRAAAALGARRSHKHDGRRASACGARAHRCGARHFRAARRVSRLALAAIRRSPHIGARTCERRIRKLRANFRVSLVYSPTTRRRFAAFDAAASVKLRLCAASVRTPLGVCIRRAPFLCSAPTMSVARVAAIGCNSAAARVRRRSQSTVRFVRRARARTSLLTDCISRLQLIVGTASGELTIVAARGETRSTSALHTQPVTALCWLAARLLLSAALDGRLVLSTLTVAGGLEPLRSATISVGDLPRAMKRENNSALKVGVVAAIASSTEICVASEVLRTRI